MIVFEKDVAKFSKGQKVYFNVASLADKDWEARIISIEKNFEQDPKALHVHAVIKNRTEKLVPGMYIPGRIAVKEVTTTVFPEASIAKNNNRFFVFQAEKKGDGWSFKPEEVSMATQINDWDQSEISQRAIS